jgi:hypothetical protein
MAELPLYLAAAGAAALLAALALRLWRATLSIPFTYSSDALAVGAHFKTVIETGWYEDQPALGAPFGQRYHEFPQADNLHMAVARLMSLVVDHWAVAMNIYYLIGFPLAAITAVWLFRLVGVSRPFSVVLAVLFALAPYHFERNQTHLFLGSYYPVPLALGVVVMALRGQPLWGRRAGVRPALLAGLTGSGAFTVLAMVLVASGSAYYGLFTAILLVVAGLAALSRDRCWRRLTGVAAAAAVLAAVMLANMAPDLLYQRNRDPNTVVVTRDAAGAEVYGLKLTQLLLPSDQHRWEPLRHIRQTYNRTFPLPGESPVLGAVAASGLLILLVVMVSALAARPSPQTQTATALRHLAIVAFAALAVAQIGGFSSLLAIFVTDNVRGWNRMAIFIAALCLAAVGLVLDRCVELVKGRRPGSRMVAGAAQAVVAIGILGLGILDQTSGSYVPDYAGVRDQYSSDTAYVRGVEGLVPVGASIYQLPYQVFPESPPVNGVADTEQLRPYLSSTRVRWSGGALKGRPQADWPQSLAGRPTPVVVRLLAISGFAGISVDRQALGQDGERVEAELAAEVGSGPTVTSRDGRFAFWPLGGVGDRMAARFDRSQLEVLRQGTLLPPVVYFGADFEGPLALGATTGWRSRAPAALLLLDNARDTPLAARLRLAVSSPTGAASIVVRPPGQPLISLDLTGGPALLDVDLVLPPGRSHLGLRLTPPTRGGARDPEGVAFEVADVSLTDPAYERISP